MRSRNDIPHDIIKYYPDYLKEAGYYVSNGMKTDYNIGGRPDDDCWDASDKKVSNGEVSSVDWETLGNQQPFFKISVVVILQQCLHKAKISTLISLS